MPSCGPRANGAFATLLLAGLLVGCAGLSTGDRVEDLYECRVSPENGSAARARPDSPTVMKIALTDQGELERRCQWTDALHALQVERPQVIVLYVHGWGHDAHDHDDDLTQFRAYIGRLSEREASRPSTRDVVGIYVGWPGVTLRFPVIESLTYWSRQRSADRISQSAVVSKLVGAIHNVRRQAHQDNDLFVAIGHSFGARILYTATSQLILYNLQNQHPGSRGGTYGLVRGPAHLIVMLNAALEASAYTALDTVRRRQEKFETAQQPIILSLSTSNDLATKAAFPIGQWFGGMWHERDRAALGNYPPYVTHSLEANDGKPRHDAPWWYDAFCKDTLCLRRTERRQPGNPFIVATTSSDVLNGHNGIWMPAFLRWLNAFIDRVDDEKLTTPARAGEVSVP